MKKIVFFLVLALTVIQASAQTPSLIGGRWRNMWEPKLDFDYATKKYVDSLIAIVDGGGSVSSVGLTVGTSGTDVSVTGSPITSTGSFTLNLPSASGINRGLLTAADWSAFNSKSPALTFNIPLVNTSNTITINNAAADGSTKGAATYTANDFNSSSGVISIDYTNGQNASNSQPGFLSSSDWTAFNSKLDAVLNSGLIFVGNGSNTATGVSLTLSGTGGSFSLSNAGVLTMPNASTSTRGLLTNTDWNTFNSKQGALTLTTTGAGAASLIGNTLNVPTPSNAPQPSVGLATTSALAANTYSNGTLGVGATITLTSVGVLTVDGTTVHLNDDVLIKDEVNQTHNGVYTCTTEGTVSVAAILTRRTNYDQSAEIVAGTYFPITSGTTNSTTTWIMVTGGTITVGTTNILFRNTYGSVVLINTAYNGNMTINQSVDMAIEVGANGGTGAFGISLPNPVPGTFIAVCDAGLASSTSNITIDAGSGKSIKGVTSAQIYVINTNGLCVGMRAVSTTVWKIEYDYGSSSGGTVSQFNFTNGGGFTGTVTNATSTPTLSLVLQNASTSQAGQLTSTDWNTFNGKLGTSLTGGNIFVGNGSNVATSVTPTLSGTGGTFALSNSGVFTFPNATTSIRGLLTSADWNTFNGKQSTLTLTTTGSSGAATLIGNTLNIPSYSGGGITYGGVVDAGHHNEVLWLDDAGNLTSDIDFNRQIDGVAPSQTIGLTDPSGNRSQLFLEGGASELSTHDNSTNLITGVVASTSGILQVKLNDGATQFIGNMPVNNGNSGDVLTSNGANPATYSWQPSGGGSFDSTHCYTQLNTDILNACNDLSIQANGNVTFNQSGDIIIPILANAGNKTVISTDGAGTVLNLTVGAGLDVRGDSLVSTNTDVKGGYLRDTTFAQTVGSTVTLNDGITAIIFVNAATVITTTLILPPNPMDGQTLLIKSNGLIGGLTITGNGRTVGSLVGLIGITAANAVGGITLIFNANANTWY